MSKTPSPNQKALDLCKKMKALEKRAFAVHGRMAGLRRQIEEVCIHNEIETKHGYEPGGYLERSVYINKDVCKVCGKVLYEERISGSFE